MPNKPNTGAFFGIALALMAPFFAFVVYFGVRMPTDHAPMWFTNTIMVWLVTSVLILIFVGKRMFKSNDQAGSSIWPARTKRGIWIVRIWGSYLMVVWTVLFIMGIVGTIEGRYELRRVIPAGAFVLFFMVIFGLSIYRTFRPKA